MTETTGMRRWRWLRIHDRETTLQQLIRILNERLKALADFLAAGGPGDGLYAAEGFFFNAGNVLVASESDYLDVPSDFTITNAELVGDQAGTLSVSVYAASYGALDPSGARWTLISASDPLTLSGTDKSQSNMVGWTRTLTGGHYLKFVITGTPTSVTKATATLTLSAPLGAGTAGASPSGPAGGVLSGTYPSPTFALDPYARANHTGTQTAATISDFNSSARAQTEAELVAGSGITITPGSSGATRTLTLAATGTSALASYWSNTTLVVNPDTAADTIIPGMSVTFTVTASTDVLIRFSVRAAKNGFIVLSLYEGGVKLAPLSGGGAAPPPAGWYLASQNGFERLNQQGTFELGYTFAAGTHTVDLYHAASANLNSISFFERTLTVTKL